MRRCAESACGELIVYPSDAALATQHFPKGARADGPLMECGAPDAERILNGLVGPGAETVR
jgi:hypothetical protein